MTTNLRVITPPTAEPITIEEARLHLRLDTDGSPPANPNDALVLALITAARESAEAFLAWALTDAVYEYRVNCFPSCSVLPLPLARVASVSAVTYVDTDGAVQTLVVDTDYVFDDNPDAPSVRLPWGAAWPVSRSQANAIVITFQGAYDNTGSPPRFPPKSINAAMLLMIGHWYAKRESVNIGAIPTEVPMGAKFLLQPFRLGMGV